MNLSLNFVALFLLTFLTFYAEVVNGCTCSEMSVADIFCMSDFGILHIYYKFEVLIKNIHKEI